MSLAGTRPAGGGRRVDRRYGSGRSNSSEGAAGAAPPGATSDRPPHFWGQKGPLAFRGRLVQEASVLYMSVSGGFGQVYELAFALFARIRRMSMILHYHSYAYLDQPRRLTRTLIGVAGKRTTHVVLSDGMARRLEATYPKALGRAVAVSNAGLLLDAPSAHAPVRSALRTIGFLGNISGEKGVFDFLDVAAELERMGSPIKALLAGPFQDMETESAVRARLGELSQTRYVGPRYGAEKDEFFREIDVLLFPTRYSNEAEPLVVHEAMMSGVPVVAYDRGAIREVVVRGSGLVIDRNSDFAYLAVAAIRAWANSDADYREASRAARTAYVHARKGGLRAWGALQSEILRITAAV